MMDFDCPLAFRHKKGEYIWEMFLAFFVLVFVLGGDFIFNWLELVELFRLYRATLSLLCWVIHVRGSIFCGSCFKLLIDLWLWVLHYYMTLLFVFEIKIFIFLYLYFFHTCGYAFCLSVSGNIQVDLIKLLSTLATDG